MYYHNPAFTLIRPSPEEMRRIGQLFVRKLNEAKGPVRVVLPLRGMSISGLEGGSTHDPEGDRILFDTIEKGLRPDIPVIEVDAHVNEERFIDGSLKSFLKSWEKSRSSKLLRNASEMSRISPSGQSEMPKRGVLEQYAATTKDRGETPQMGVFQQDLIDNPNLKGE